MKKCFKTLLAAITLLMLCIPFSGCGGGGAKVTATSTTVGQELVDLQKAYDQGIINEKEYNKLKEEIMKRKK